MDINNILASLEAKHPGEKEYLQAVKEVLLCVEDVYTPHPEFEKARGPSPARRRCCAPVRP